MQSESAGSSKAVVITGGNAGLGFQTALVLANAGWHVIVACRDSKAGASAGAVLIHQSKGTAETQSLDLASLASVRAFAGRLSTTSAQRPSLHALVCNAGTQTVTGLTFTADKFESTFGVNVLGHFLLTSLVLPLLVRPARVVFVSSSTHDPSDFGSRAFGMNPPHLCSATQMAFPNEDKGPIPADAPGRGREAYTTSQIERHTDRQRVRPPLGRSS